MYFYNEHVTMKNVKYKAGVQHNCKGVAKFKSAATVCVSHCARTHMHNVGEGLVPFMSHWSHKLSQVSVPRVHKNPKQSKRGTRSRARRSQFPDKFMNRDLYVNCVHSLEHFGLYPNDPCVDSVTANSLCLGLRIT